MPASRSRTERWRECLEQVLERGGGIEIAVDREHDAAESGADLMWRVRLFGLSDQEMLVERPSAAGHPMEFPVGTALTGLISIGQNRWSFRTKVLGVSPMSAGRPGGVRIAMPTTVERCQRREFGRASTEGLSLPLAECWPLRDPTSVVAAELYNRATILELQRLGTPWDPNERGVLPDVGPSVSAHLLNIGGGGLGLMIDKHQAGLGGRSPLAWIRLDLRPEIVAPIAMTLRIAHTRLDHEQNVHLGVAFDFSFNPAHREFVVGQMAEYAAKLTRPVSKAA